MTRSDMRTIPAGGPSGRICPEIRRASKDFRNGLGGPERDATHLPRSAPRPPKTASRPILIRPHRIRVALWPAWAALTGSGRPLTGSERFGDRFKRFRDRFGWLRDQSKRNRARPRRLRGRGRTARPRSVDRPCSPPTSPVRCDLCTPCISNARGDVAPRHRGDGRTPQRDVTVTGTSRRFRSVEPDAATLRWGTFFDPELST